MHPQAMVNLFAKLAKPRLWELFKLKSAEHIYDPTPGRVPAKFVHDGREILLNKFPTSLQPYKDIHRFVADERVMTYVVDPGLLPIVKSLLLDVRGQKLLVTRKVGPKNGESPDAAVAHVDGFGLRIVATSDADTRETSVLWECLYGVE
jgi:hypothetical protein